MRAILNTLNRVSALLIRWIRVRVPADPPESENPSQRKLAGILLRVGFVTVGWFESVGVSAIFVAHDLRCSQLPNLARSNGLSNIYT